MTPKVSIILPAYNAAAFLGRWFEANVFSQSLRPSEVIMVNDGSTDATEEVVGVHALRLKEAGISFHYRRQENGGVGAAMDAALKLFTGDYLVWVDADDYLTVDSIEKRVRFLEANPEFGFVRSDGLIYKAEVPSVPIGLLSNKNPNRFNENIFDDLLFERTYCTPGCYMIRASVLLQAMPSRSIYPSRAGQNLQILLPIAWRNKCGFIDEPFFRYVISPTSHSHSDRTCDDHFRRLSGHEDLLLNVLSSIQDIDHKCYHHALTCEYARKRLSLAYKFEKYDIAVKSAKLLWTNKSLTAKDLLTLLRVKWPALDSFVHSLRGSAPVKQDAS